MPRGFRTKIFDNPSSNFFKILRRIIPGGDNVSNTFDMDFWIFAMNILGGFKNNCRLWDVNKFLIKTIVKGF